MPISWNHPGGEDVPDDKLPSWFLRARAKHAARIQAAAKAAMAPITVTVPSRAPGWHDAGMELSCCPDSVYPWDPDVMRAVQKLRPDLVPLWVRWIFLTPPEEGPQKEVVFGRHGLGRIDEAALSEPWPFKCPMPTMPCQGLTFQRPNKVWMIFDGEKDKRAVDLPGAYIPFSWNVLQFVQGCPDLSAREINRLEAKKREAQNALREARKEQQDYIKADLDRFADKLLSRMSETEMKERLLGGVPQVTRPSVLVGKHAGRLPA